MTHQITKSRQTRGWCPGTLRPMESGDGLIVRVRPHSGRLNLEQAKSIALCAHNFGNGLIDLTRRANLQIRGVTDDTLPTIVAKLSVSDLVDHDEHAEAVRNIIMSPLSGFDPSEAHDMSAIAQEIEEGLACDKELWCLPGKFGFSLDGGGVLSLSGERADIYLKAYQAGIAIGVDSKTGPRWVGTTETESAGSVALKIAFYFLQAREIETRRRIRDLPDRSFKRIVKFLQQIRKTEAEPASLMVQCQPPQGIVRYKGRPIAVGLAAPFGRIDADRFLTFLDEIKPDGLRLSPWRTFYVPIGDDKTAKAILNHGQHAGFITTPDDPKLRIDACPGSPACRSATFDTRNIAMQLVESGVIQHYESVHISGCPKGCARSKPADLVLFGDENSAKIVRNGTICDNPDRVVSLQDLEKFVRSIDHDEEVRAHA